MLGASRQLPLSPPSRLPPRLIFSPPPPRPPPLALALSASCINAQVRSTSSTTTFIKLRPAVAGHRRSCTESTAEGIACIYALVVGVHVCVCDYVLSGTFVNELM